MLFVLFLVIGLVVGSFVNVLVDRLATDQSIFFPASHCDRCRKRLVWYDLIPVVSFVLLGGRCRFCRSPINIQYPIVELLTGLLFTFSIFNFQFLIFNENCALCAEFLLHTNFKFQILNLLFTLYIISSFIVIFFADLKYGIIPDKIIYPAIGASLIYNVYNNYNNYNFYTHLLAGAGAFLFFLAIFLLTRGRGMGFGDVKLSFLLGLIFGFPKIVTVLYIAFLTGAGFSIILMMLLKKKPKDTIAFGPFLVLGALVVLFFWDFLYSTVLINIWFLPAALP